MNTFITERNPFDILVRNFFQDAGAYRPLAESKLPHPVDIYERDNGLGLDIACTGISKEDIEILIEGNIIRVNYDKPKEDDLGAYIHRGTMMLVRSCKVGDLVMIPKIGTLRIDYDGEEYYIAQDREVLAVIEKEAPVGFEED